MKEKYNWWRRYLYSRWSIPTGYASHFIFSVIIMSALIYSFCKIIISSGMILFTANKHPYFNANFTTSYISETGILGSQITLTLICVSLIALISNIEKKYLYGERLIDLAFYRKGIFSFKCIMVILFALLILNIYLMLNNTAFVYVAFVFLITLYIATIVLYRFGSIFLSQQSIKKRLLRKYYHCNLIHMKKNKPIEPYISIPLENLKNITLKHIITNNVPELNENVRLYFNLLRLTLFNKPKVVQEYYTELTNAQDVIGHIIELSLKMFETGNQLYGIQTYNALLKNLNYYKIAANANLIAHSPVHPFIEAFSDIKSKIQVKEYLNQLLIMNKAIIEQYQLQTIIDLSYCRLSKNDYIHFFSCSDIYAKVYDMIIKSDWISVEDKDKLIETIRGYIFDLYTSLKLKRDIDCFWNKTRFSEERNFQIDIKNEPVAQYFLRLIEKNDIFNLWQYDLLGSGKNTAYFAKILAILSVLNMLNNGNKREYLYDIEIDEVSVRKTFKESNFLKMEIREAEIQEYYSFILAHYVEDVESNNLASGGIYGFNPKFNFKKEVVDTYFAYLLSCIQNNKSVDVVVKEKGYVFNKNLYNKIISFESGKTSKGIKVKIIARGYR